MKRNLTKFSALLSFTIILAAIYNPTHSMESKSEEVSNNQEFTQSESLNTISLSNKNVTEISIPPIEWGVLSNYFVIENVKAGMHQKVDRLGRWGEFPLVTFIVEAKRHFEIPPVYFAHFYDSEGIEVSRVTILGFEPNYTTWNEGMRSRVNFLLPRDMSNVAVIKISQV